MAMMSWVMIAWMLGLGGGAGWLGGGGATPSADMPQRYAVVAGHLDTGGDLYVVRNTEGQLENALKGMAGLAPLMGGMRGGSQPDVIAPVTAFLKDNGFTGLQCVGASTVPRPDGLKDMKLFLMRDATTAERPLWRGLLGGAPAKPELLGCLPADTALFLQARGEPARLWAMVRDGQLRFGADGDEQKLQATLAEIAKDWGIAPDELFASLGDEWVLSLQLAEPPAGAPPGPGGLSLPVPAFLVVAKAQDDRALALGRQLFVSGGAPGLMKSEVEGAVVYSAPAPKPGPFPMQPAMCWQDGVLFFGSTPEVVAAALKCRREGGGVAAGEACRALLGTLPAESNMLFYSDARLARTLNGLRAQFADAAAGGGPTPFPRELGAIFLGGTSPEVSSGWAAVNGADGVALQGTGSGQVARQFAGVGGLNPLMLAAIALPSFQKARSTSMRNACINNLRQIDGAKEQWAIENNRNQGEVPAAADISPYIKGGFANLRCPQGGAYQINPVGTNPTCTNPRHLLP